MPTRLQIHMHLELVTFFGNRAFAHVSSLGESHWIRMGPKSNVISILKRRQRDRHTGQTPGEDGAKTGVMHLQPKNSKDCRPQSEAGSSVEGSSPRPFGRGVALQTCPSFWTSRLQNGERISTSFMPPSLW